MHNRFYALILVSRFELLDKPRILGKPAGIKEQRNTILSGELGYCFDVIDGPAGTDSALRPNQLFAVSLPYSPLSPVQQRAVVDACAGRLLTSHGLRSLSPDDPAYEGHYGGDRRQRDADPHNTPVRNAGPWGCDRHGDVVSGWRQRRGAERGAELDE